LQNDWFCKSNGVGRLRPTGAGSGVKYCQQTSCEIQPETAEGREQTCNRVLQLPPNIAISLFIVTVACVCNEAFNIATCCKVFGAAYALSLQNAGGICGYTATPNARRIKESPKPTAI